MDPEENIAMGVAETSEGALTLVGAEDRPGLSEADMALASKLLEVIKADKAKFKPAFDRMREDMELATHGRLKKEWSADKYVVNIIGRHVKQKTAALYAKNPKIDVKKRETLDFALWDGNPDSLMLAQQTMQMAQMAPQQMDPMTGAMVPVPGAGPSPEELEMAIAVMQDFQQGLEKRTQLAKYSKTLALLFENAMDEQKPLNFKMGMKKLVRRTCTTGVGYVKLAFARELGRAPVVENQIYDAQSRMAHLQNLMEKAQEGEIEEISAEMRELEISISSLQNEELIVVREGLIFDYPQSTRVIPDSNTTSLVGFVGARHLTLEYLYTRDEILEQFPDVNLDLGFTPFGKDLKNKDGDIVSPAEPTTDSNGKPRSENDGGMVLLYEHYDKPSGQVYHLIEGYPGLARAPSPPDVFVEDFWPVYALTFNEVENEEELYPPSDARLMYHQQVEMNRSREAKRNHRIAALPRYFTQKGILDDKDKVGLASATPFSVTELNVTQVDDISKLLQTLPLPGVDPNIYETSEYFQDLQLAVGSQQATLGGISKATATEAAISESSMAASDGSSVDDLDNFLCCVARGGGQILQREMSAEKVIEIVGPGAFWPEMTLDQIANNVYLVVKAGSSGKPNQAVDINNMQTLLPFLMQMPGLNPQWILQQVLTRMDDKLDLVDAIAAGIPSIAAQNQNAQTNMVSPGGPQDNPAAQGGAGPQGASGVPGGPSENPGGSGPAFGSNQV